METIQTQGRCARHGRQTEMAGADLKWTENPDRENHKNSIQPGTREMSRSDKQKSDPNRLSAKIHKRLQTWSREQHQIMMSCRWGTSWGLGVYLGKSLWFLSESGEGNSRGRKPRRECTGVCLQASTAHWCPHWLPRHILFMPSCILAFSRDVDDVFLQTQGPFLIFRVSERGGQISLEILSPVYYHRMKQCFFLFQCS